MVKSKKISIDGTEITILSEKNKVLNSQEMKEKSKYAAFLRGINVGGHHKVPMAELKKEMAALGYSEVETLLNSGNVIFSAPATAVDSLEETIASRLEATFGFPVPVLVKEGGEMLQLLSNDPFKEIEKTDAIRLYVSFLKLHPQEIQLPWVSEDQSYRIISVEERMVFSVLDLSGTGTTKGMDSLEKIFGKNITTRNWNTIEKIAANLKS